MSFAAGESIGVELDEPKGMHDGTVFNESYFTCRACLLLPNKQVPLNDSGLPPQTCLDPHMRVAGINRPSLLWKEPTFSARQTSRHPAGMCWSCLIRGGGGL